MFWLDRSLSALSGVTHHSRAEPGFIVPRSPLQPDTRPNHPKSRRGLPDSLDNHRSITPGRFRVSTGSPNDIIPSSSSSEHHRHITKHPTRIMRRPARTGIGHRPRQARRQPQPVSKRDEQTAPGVRHHTRVIRDHFYASLALRTRHLQGEPPGRVGSGFDTRILPAQADVPAPAAPQPRGATERSGLVD